MSHQSHYLQRLPVHAALVSVLGFLGYVAVARSVDNLYPFSTFSMYAADHPRSSSRVVARDAAGRVLEVTQFRAWDCPTAPSPEPAACDALQPFYAIPYADREIVRYVQLHRGAGGEAVDVIRRVWQLSAAGGVSAPRDCVLARCRAVRQ